MQNRDIQFTPKGVLLSNETYDELRRFCLTHGETDLPAIPELEVITIASVFSVEEKKSSKPSSKPKDE